MSILYTANSLVRLVNFVSRMLVGLVLGFILGFMVAEGKIHLPIAQAATIDPYLRTPSGNPIPPGIVDIFYSATDFAPTTTYYTFSILTDHYPFKYTSGCLPTDPGTITSELEIAAEPGNYYSPRFTEYNDSTCFNSTGSTLEDDNFDVVASSTATTTPVSQLTSKDTLFLWGVAIFLLAYPVWSRVFSV